VCEAPLTRQKKALVAPFLASRIWNKKAFRVELANCSRCGTAFFNPRFDDLEAMKLYDNYRDDRYQRERFDHEPWYTKNFNDRFKHDTRVLDFRQKQLRLIMGKYTDPGSLISVLDFGGDKGQLVQNLFRAQAFVYDISGVETLDGVTKVSDVLSCKKSEYDLVICSHVLEHVAFPRSVLSDIERIAGRKTFLLLEVPMESPFALTSIAKRLLQFSMMCGTRIRSAVELLDPALIYIMHEHVNFFSPRSLKLLLEQANFSVIAQGTYSLPISAFFRPKTIWCLGRPHQTATN
jgi:2-polyprenyl-3-methyl-5-hydroxy-6-metoxy-1,4-benzoquinol methylase